MYYKTARVPKKLFTKAEVMEAWKRPLESDEKSKTGDGEEEIIHKLELMELCNMQVKQLDPVEIELATRSEIQLISYQEVEKRALTSERRQSLNLAKAQL